MIPLNSVIVHEATTDVVGTYRMDGLQPGNYTVTFTGSGLATLSVGSVVIVGANTTTVNGLMQVGESNPPSLLRPARPR